MTGVLAALAFGAVCFWRGVVFGHRDGTETARALCELSIHAERQRCREVQAGRLYGPKVIARPSKAACN